MGKNLTKAAIVESIYDKTGLTRPEAQFAVEKLLALMKSAIKKDNVLMITNFGRFEVITKAPKPGRNPRTSEPITIPSRKAVMFRISRKFKKELNRQ